MTPAAPGVTVRLFSSTLFEPVPSSGSGETFPMCAALQYAGCVTAALAVFFFGAGFAAAWVPAAISARTARHANSAAPSRPGRRLFAPGMLPLLGLANGAGWSLNPAEVACASCSLHRRP